MSGSVDPVTGVAQILSVFVGAAAAAAIAPHLVVLIAGMAGGVLGLMAWRKCSVFEGIAYVIAAGMGAWLFAGNLAELMTSLWPWLGDRRIVSPVALGIGWVGHRWPQVGRWFAGMLRASAEAALKRGDK